MRDMDKEVRDLHQKTTQTRYAFLQAELETCFTAIDMAKYEISVGNIDVAEREVSFVEDGIRTLRRFLTDMPPEEQRKIENRAGILQAMLDEIKAKLNRQSSDT
jgi:hypothetical protein